MNFVDYLPFLKLGIAHYELGNHDAALRAFEREGKLGVIDDSRRHLQDLQRYQDLAQQARDAAADAERARLVAASLEQAATLERQGRIEDAIAELSKADAVDRDNPDVVAMVTRLNATLEDQQEERDRDARFTQHVENGRRLLDGQQFAEAATEFDQALRLKPDSTEARSLRDRSRSSLQDQIQQDRDATALAEMIEEELERARGFQQSGDFGPALDAVQRVLGADSDNAEATRLREELLAARDQSERVKSQNERVQGLITEAQGLFDSGDYRGAQQLAFRAYMRDQANSEVFQFLQIVSKRLRDELLEIGQGDIPPLIEFAEDNQGAPEDETEPGIESVDYPNFTLSGSVYSSTKLRKLEYSVNGTAVELGGNGLPLEDGQVLTQFQVDHTLPSGTSTFRIVATDTNDKSVTREYSVIYRVPFYISTWFYASLLVLVVAVAGVLYSRQVIHRRQKLKRRFNPYIAGAPVVKDQQFYGRDMLMTRVLQTIHNNSILLYGERRIGKTSFQHRLKKRLKDINDPEYDFYPVYIDLQGTPETKFFSTLGHDMFDELAPLLDGVQPNEALQDGSDYDYRDLVRDIRAVLHALKKRSDKRIKLVLLIDEVDELNSYDPRVNQRLRSLFMKGFAEDLVAVVSGVGIKKEWESAGSPWYNFFEEIQVKPFRREDAVDLIEKPIQGVFKLETGVTDRIITLTDCKPYLIQKLCVALVNRLHEQQRRVITLTDVNALGRPQVE
jgi:tetratricopeptide (TPR) repeat protein